MQFSNFQNSTLLRMEHIIQRDGSKRSTYFKRVKSGVLPPPIKIGERMAVTPAYEIDAINVARINGKSDDEVRQLVQEMVAARSEINPVAVFLTSGRKIDEIKKIAEQINKHIEEA